MDTAEQRRTMRAQCREFLNGDGLVTPAQLLASVDPDVVPDVYGEGGVVADLERYVASLLAKPSAVFLPSGTMAQAATLRVHADRRTSRTVVWHPTCHLDKHEGQGFSRLHSLIGRPVGSADQLLTLDHLQGVAEPVAALLLELPAREIGGQLPSWTDLISQVEWARSRGAATHLDGARLWEASAGYDRTPAEIAALFDTVYVSFYKGIGALPGCCVAGSAEIVAEVREWRRRLGGTLHAMWPSASSAMSLLPQRLAEMPGRMAHMRAIAEELAKIAGVKVVPAAPQVPMVHLLLPVGLERFAENSARLARQQVWTWPTAVPTLDPEVVRCELTVGRATCELTAERVAGLIAELSRN
jgi:threonine aldolase